MRVLGFVAICAALCGCGLARMQERQEQMQAALAAKDSGVAKLGAGKLPDDALLFTRLDGALPSQMRYSKAWSDFADQIKMPELAFHNLRHTHASQLIDEGVVL
jgi:integrase